jgi:two-component system response regulator NreC
VLADCQGIVLVGEAASGLEALEQAKQLQPTVVLMDLSLPDLSGVEVTRRLKAKHPEMQIIAFSARTESAQVLEALEAGASAYLVKQGALKELRDAVLAVLAGFMFLSPVVTRPIVEVCLRKGAALPAEKSLHTREREVLRQLASGLTSKEIAQRLQISSRTVDVHRQNIMKKLKARSLPELVKYAIRQNLIDLEPAPY